MITGNKIKCFLYSKQLQTWIFTPHQNCGIFKTFLYDYKTLQCVYLSKEREECLVSKAQLLNFVHYKMNKHKIQSFCTHVISQAVSQSFTWNWKKMKPQRTVPLKTSYQLQTGKLCKSSTSKHLPAPPSDTLWPSPCRVPPLERPLFRIPAP